MSFRRAERLFRGVRACDGVSLSNTLLLEKTTLGRAPSLSPPGRGTRRCSAIATATSPTSASTRPTGSRCCFNEVDIGELSGMEDFADGDFHAQFRQDRRQYPVATISLDRFLAEARAPRRIDYMSIDVEGGEFDVLQSFDFTRHDIALISVEHNFSGSRRRSTRC